MCCLKFVSLGRPCDYIYPLNFGSTQALVLLYVELITVNNCWWNLWAKFPRAKMFLMHWLYSTMVVAMYWDQDRFMLFICSGIYGLVSILAVV